MTSSEELVEESVEEKHLSRRVDEVHVDDFSSCERVDRPVEKEGVGGDLRIRRRKVSERTSIETNLGTKEDERRTFRSCMTTF